MHGSLFEFYRNSKMDAKNYFDILGKPPLSRHQFGGSVGGPLKTNKAFFFGTYEGINQDRSETRIVTVPDLDARRGVINGVNVGVSPAIAGALAHLDCDLAERVQVADHTIFIGRVREARTAAEGGEPLVYFRRAYRTLAPSLDPSTRKRIPCLSS